MTVSHPTRRDLLQSATKAGAVLLTVSVTAKSLGLSAAAQAPEKIVLGTLPINPGPILARSTSSKKRDSWLS